MKKITAWLMTVVMVLALLPLGCFVGAAEDVYTIKVITTSGNNIHVEIAYPNTPDVTEVTLPTEYEGKTITGIRSVRGTYLEKVTIPATVDYVLVGAAFLWCSSLQAIDVVEDNAVFSSVDGVLLDKAKSKLILYPTGRTDESYEIPSSVKTIGLSAFYRNTHIKRIRVPAGMTDIPQGNTPDCIEYIDVDPDNSVYYDVDGVLFDKEQNKLIYYPPARTETTYAVPEGTKVIDRAFIGCEALECVTVPEGVTSMGIWFEDCPNLTTVCLPASIETVADVDELTVDCNRIAAFEVDENNPYFCDVDGVLYNKEKTVLIKYPYGNENTVYIAPKGLTTVQRCAFKEARYLESIILPDTVISIGELAFHHCHSLKEFRVPKQVTVLEYGLFMYCYSLERLTLPEGITTSSVHVFESCDVLADIYYTGSEEEFAKIEGFVFFNPWGFFEQNALDGKTVHYNYLEIDWDGNNSFDMRDMLAVYQVACGKETATIDAQMRMDVNGDFVFNMRDVLLLYRQSAGKE